MVKGAALKIDRGSSWNSVFFSVLKALRQYRGFGSVGALHLYAYLSNSCRMLNSHGFFLIGPYGLHIRFLSFPVSVQRLAQLEQGIQGLCRNRKEKMVWEIGQIGARDSGTSSDLGPRARQQG